MTSKPTICATPSTAQEDLFLGIDVGGTNVKLGLIDASGVMRSKHALATPDLVTPERVFDASVAFADRELSSPEYCKFKLSGIGLAVPGVLDSREAVLREVVNLPQWKGKRLREILRKSRDLPNVVVNDANSAAYAEHALRSLGNKSLALVTLGTGIGCGLVMNGSPYGGDHGCAGELGHIAIRFGKEALPCTCGKMGHLEAYAGSKGVVRQLHSLAKTTNNSEIASLLTTDIVTPRDIAARAQNGCELCNIVIDQTARYLGQAIGQLAQVIDPTVVLLGGAMTFGGSQSKVGQKFLATVRNTIISTTLEEVGSHLQVEFASLGNDAGVIGAAKVAQQVIAS
ncbi:MAG: glucokinase [Rhodopirellula sp.]|nr:glucokinase [Rhodopirellula sp.]OUX49768.1 MAG: glucokinase [Rhodopirellula sp. TMED283]